MSMLTKLAFRNVHRSAREYIVYFLTLSLSVAVFYAFNTIGVQAKFLRESTQELVKNIGMYITALTVFLALITGFLMVYANNFLMRYRKRELALYQVFGMRRLQVVYVIMLETLFVALAALAIGFVLGAAISQVLVFVTAHIFEKTITEFRFFFSSEAFITTCACFVVTFVVMSCFNMRSLHQVKLVDSMSAAHQSEKIKVKGLVFSSLLFVVGAALIGGAYYRLITQGFPGASATGTTLADFGITTAMVFVGTFVLFYGLAGFLLAVAQRSKRFYNSGLHSFTVREMSNQINTNCVSMGFISLILFFAITCVTTGSGLVSALKSSEKQALPFDATISMFMSRTGIKHHTLPASMQAFKQAGFDVSSIGKAVIVRLCRPAAPQTDPQALAQAGSAQSGTQALDRSEVAKTASLGAFAATAHKKLPAGFEHANVTTQSLDFMALSTYNKLREFAGATPVSLAHDEYLLTANMMLVTDIYKAAVERGHTITLNGKTYKPATQGFIGDKTAGISNNFFASNTGTIVVADDVIANYPVHQLLVNINYAQGTDVKHAEDFLGRLCDDSQSFKQAVFGERASDPNVAHKEVYPMLLTRAMMKSQGLDTRGMITYLALYIGFVLVIACAAIMAIQRLSSASAAAGRYRMLSDLGSSQEARKRSLLFQTFASFMLPLLVGLAHSICALMVISDILRIFGGFDIINTTLSFIIFVSVYGGYLFVTYAVSLRLIEAQTDNFRRE